MGRRIEAGRQGRERWTNRRHGWHRQGSVSGEVDVAAELRQQGLEVNMEAPIARGAEARHLADLPEERDGRIIPFDVQGVLQARGLVLLGG